ncbi:MAG: DNA polymerase III, subunit gamma and tau [Deltaproteobacteria bacterium RIFCSPHIGHO2_12_FULL_43_9]|nr:MAG: DNA polymerase III, subunit gamma and tau [Deltaproteobacteria bacterium RIFCSPHIGHO2_12_FULL_43_9]
MSYLVLARKYRPQLFSDVVGQSHVTKTLINAVINNRVAHAFLFTGPRGVGKTSTARILAKVLRCEDGKGGEPCNKCLSCEEITAGKAIDVQEIDGASNNGVDSIRELREHINYLPTTGKFKVYIVDEVHMLSGSAFNAFLKTLEEPPPHVYFIFATTEPQKIPVTIHSRCQIYDFKRVAAPQIVDYLVQLTNREQIIVPPKSLSLIARESEGCLRDALGLLDQAYAYAGQNITEAQVSEVLGVVDSVYPIEILRAIINRDGKRVLEIIREVYDAGYDISQVVKALLEACRNVSVIVAAPDFELPDLSEGEKQEYRMLSTQVSAMQVYEWFRFVLRAQGEIARAQFPRQIFEMMVLRLMTIEKLVPIAEILSRLDNVEEVHNSPKTTLNMEVNAESDANVSSPILLEPTKEDWDRFIQVVKGKKPLLATILEEGQLVDLNDREIVIGYEDGSFCGKQLSDPDHKRHFEKFAREYFTKSLSLKISTLTNKNKSRTPSVVERGDGALNSDMSHDSIVEEAKKIFRGEVVSS